MKGLVLSILVVLLGPAQADSSEFRQRLFGASKELGHEQFAEREAALSRMQKLNEGERQEALECLRDLWTEEKTPRFEHVSLVLRVVFTSQKRMLFLGSDFFQTSNSPSKENPA